MNILNMLGNAGSSLFSPLTGGFSPRSPFTPSGGSCSDCFSPSREAALGGAKPQGFTDGMPGGLGSSGGFLSGWPGGNGSGGGFLSGWPGGSGSGGSGFLNGMPSQGMGGPAATSPFSSDVGYDARTMGMAFLQSINQAL